MAILNPNLVKQQNLSNTTIELLEGLHIAMAAHKNRELSDIPDIPEYVELIQEIEFAMQRLWGFEEDSKYHNHWFTDPKCQCPVFDNHDLSGINRSVINLSCPLHGDKPKEP